MSTVGRDETVIGDYIPAARGGGQAIGSNEPVALSGHRKVAPNRRGRIRDPA